MLFYALLWLAFRRVPWTWRLVMALGAEAGWEMIENTAYVIARYRQTGIANGYAGDTILNSVSDSLSMAFGFTLARLGPKWFSLVWVLASESILAFLIRDNLTLNLIQLIHPFEFITRWQSGPFS